MRNIEKLAVVLVVLIGGSLSALGDDPKPIVQPPPEITFVASCAFDVANGLDDAEHAWRGVHDGRRFADGVLAGLTAPDVRAATRLARRYATARRAAERMARGSHARLARALDRWSGTWDAGFYAPAAFAGLTRAIWQAERASDTAVEMVDFCVARGASADSFAPFLAAHEAARIDAQVADNVCNTLIAQLRERCASLLDQLDGAAHRRVMEQRLDALDRVRAQAVAADGRPRATLLARTYRMLVATVRRGEAFLAQEHRSLRRLVIPAADGSITNGTGEEIMVYDIRAVLTVWIMRRKQTSHANASDHVPGSLPLLVPDGGALDGFDYLVLDRAEITDGTPGFVRLTYDTSVGDVNAVYRLR